MFRGNERELDRLTIAASQNKKEKEYWLNQLSGDLKKSMFPYDSRKTSHVPHIDAVQFELPDQLFSKLMKLSNKSDLRLHILLVAGLVLLLNKSTGAEDIIVGTSIYKQEVETDFINKVIALRNRVDQHMTFKELILMVRQTIAEASENYGYPIQLLPDKLNLSSSKYDFPLFDMALLLENIQDKRYLNDIHLNLVFSFLRRDHSLNGRLEFNSSLYHKKTIEKIVQLFTHILKEAVFNLNKQVSGLDMLSQQEKMHILLELNNTSTDYPRHRTIHGIFEEEVEKRRDHIALIFGDKQLSYGKLNEKSNQVARVLSKKGVQADSIVGLMMERSIDMMAAIIGILKGAGAYLPIDGKMPEGRIISMLADCNVSILVTRTTEIEKYSFTCLQALQAIHEEPYVTPLRPQVKNFSALPIPERSLIDYEKYSQYIGQGMVKYSVNLQATRGCPYNCAYCCRVWPRKNVSRSAENIFQEVQSYYKMGIRRFVFIDDIFNLNIKNGMRFFKLVIENKLNAHFLFPSGLRGDILTKEYIDLMVEAGTISFPLALETASPRLQKLIGKNLDIEKLRENMKYIMEKHPNVILELHTMHGFPTETEEEAIMTLDFIKSLERIHFPYIHILKIYANTDMEKLALENGISKAAIARSENMAYHKLPDTLPFDKHFTLKYQADFLNYYFLSKKRLRQVLPYQMKVLTQDEIVQKYNSYLPVELHSLVDLLEFTGITPDELEINSCLDEKRVAVHNINEKMRQAFPVKKPLKKAMRVLLLDLSQKFSRESDMLYDVVEQPLGLLYLMTYLHQQFGNKISGKIAKSRIDFDGYSELKELLEKFKPHVIGIRTLTIYRDFFHRTVALIRQWGIDVPIIAGGPYATIDFKTILQDRHVDLVVLSEGEITFGELIGKIMANNGKLPEEDTLKEIAGIAFIPKKKKSHQKFARQLVMLDELPGGSCEESTGNLENRNQGSDLAYVIFTSGSTGKPKGTLTTHANAIRIVRNTNYINLTPHDALLQLSNYAFDGSVFDIYGALLNGSRLVMLSSEEVLSVDSLSYLIEREGVTVFFVTTALFNTLVDIKKECFKHVKKVLFGGERVSPEHSQKALKYMGKERIIHVYGPTETTVYATYYFVNEIKENQATVPIGKALSNTTVYILDQYKKLLPLGVSGEIYIGGDGVARGYLNNPELTGEKFVQSPFRKGERLYKTGDWAKTRPDGNIEFLGRIDQQIKLRGFRIELEEIEYQLLKHHAVKEVVVTVKTSKKGNRRVTAENPGSENRDKYLCAYIVAHKGHTGSELRDYLLKELPEYMVPSYFVLIDRMPLNSNGKIDRNALPLPQFNDDTEYVAPTNKVEKTMAGIWSEVLETDKCSIGIDSDFFQLGGHSLKATITIARIHKELNVKIPLTEMFKMPSIRALSRYIARVTRNKYDLIAAAEKKEYYALSSAQKRLYILHQMDFTSTVYNITQIIQLEKEPDVKKLEVTFRKLIKRHESLRASFIVIEGEPVQRVHDSVEFNIACYRRSSVQVESGGINDLVGPFDPHRPPLLRVGLVNIDKKKSLLVVNMHHLISDGVSLGVLTRDFMALYDGEELPALRLQYKDYSQWQNREIQKKTIGQQEDYWLKEFSGEIPVLNLPTDYPRPRRQSFAGNAITFELEKKETSALNQLALETGATLYMVLLAIYNVLLLKLSNQDDIIVGTPLAGRRHADLEQIIGMFVHTLVMRNFPHPHMMFSAFLNEVKNRTLRAFENQEYPFEELVERIDIPRDISRNPLFDVVFAFHNLNLSTNQEPGQKKPGSQPTPDYYENRTSKFDLILTGVEAGEQLYFTFQYSTTLFKKETIQRLIKYFRKLITAVIESPGIRIAELEILTGEDKNQLMYTFNHTGADYPQDRTIQKLFEEQVNRAPYHTAVVYEDKHFTYRQLDTSANQLGNVLRAKGITIGSIVGMMVERSVEMIIGILGILKAGAAYLPLDTQAPIDRIQLMLKDADGSILLTTSNILNKYSFIHLQGLPSAEKTVHFTGMRKNVENLDELPFPARSLVNYEKYHQYIGQSLVKNSISLLGSRGCPFNCAYCHKIWPKKQVTRSAENMFLEVKTYYNMGARRFVFLDDVFNLNVKNSRRFFELIIEKGLDLHLSLCLRGDILSKDYIDLMVKAGAIRMAVALETASPRLQRLIGKHLNLKKFKENIEYICEKYPQVILELNTMHGFPGETEEEAMMTLNFIKRIRWLHFPYVHILKIYPNTDMERLALEHGVSAEDIAASASLAYHELPETLPFERNFTLMYQAKFLNEYFLSKERLLHVLPYQMRTLTQDEMVQKYNSYLPVEIKTIDDLLEFAGISRLELEEVEVLSEDRFLVPGINRKMKEHFKAAPPGKNALNVLMLDLSQFFSHESGNMLYDVVEAPLGLMYLMSYLKQHHGSKINGKIAKSRIDFDHYGALKVIVEEFKPDIIGLRALTYHRDFLHKTAAMIRQWGINVPIIAGGPYATSDYKTILQDRHINMVVIGEGEVTFSELVGKMRANGGKLPDEQVLREIAGIAFIPKKTKPGVKSAREIILLDESHMTATAPPGPCSHSKDPAYTIFTSGSTGTPKGVIMGHSSVVNLVWGLKERIYHPHQNGLHVAMVSPYVFDASVKQVFGAMLQGHALYIVPEDTRINGIALLDFYRKHQIDISDGTPTHLRLLLESLENHVLKPGLPVKNFLIGGEALPKKIVEAFLNCFVRNVPTITNVYGPTECCVDSTSYVLSREKMPMMENIPIGTPMPNVRIYIVDKGHHLLPVGTAGELLIGGDGLAKGYLNNPELTNEKYIQCPFISQDHTRITNEQLSRTYLYKTGDLAKWHADGNIEFLSRVDQQIKIRGYRVEPGEIENQLRMIPWLNEAVVLEWKDKTNEKYLCAYFVAEGEVSGAEIKRILAKKLPHYMIPSYIIRLDHIPLTVNGKIDRKALTEPEANPEDEYVPSSGKIERLLVEIWAQVLEIKKEKIGVNYNFFQLGGHSLKATIMVSKIHKSLNVKLNLTDIFKTPTIRGLSQYIKKAAENQFVSIEPAEEREFYALSAAQKRLYILQQLEPGGTSYNLPYVIPLQQRIDRERLETTFKKLIARHESLRTSFEMLAEEPIQRVHKKIVFAINNYETTGEEAVKVIKNFVSTFDLSKAPLLRVGILDIGPSDQVLLIDMHHIITDGTSQDILEWEFRALDAGEKLDPLRLQYKDYSQWQNSKEQEALIKEQETYWLHLFSDELPVLYLPIDYPRPKMQSFAGASVNFEFNEIETQVLKFIAKETGTTLYMVILTIYTVLLAKLSGHDDIIVGTPVAARRHTDLEHIIGMFVNTLAIWNYPSSGKTFKRLLAEVKNHTLEAFENQEYPFEDLVDKLSIRRDTSRNPIFDVMFNLLNQSDYTADGPEIAEQHSYEYQKNTSKFDLSLTALDRGKRLIFDLEYSTVLFKMSTIERFIRYFKRISAVLKTKDLEIKLSEIEILNSEEKNQLLFEFNQTAAPYPKNKTIQELFEAQVEKNPHHTVLVGPQVSAKEGRYFRFQENIASLTYNEVNKKANQLARLLQEKGVIPGESVGIMVERSLEMIIGVLGILKAGAAYLPLDALYPTDRKNYMYKDSNTKLLLTQKKYTNSIVGIREIILVENSEIYRGPGNNLESFYQPNDLAYIIYTSGSTGKPKGVMVEHRNVVRLVKNSNYIKFSENDRILQTGALEFDASTFEIWGSLLNGLTLQLTAKEDILTPDQLKETIRKYGIRTMWLTSPLFNQLARVDIGLFTGLKNLLVGGDVLAPIYINKVRARYPRLNIINGYGPTENTTFSTTFLIKKEYEENIPIGKPIANSTAYILDQSMGLLPVGVPGELYLGGDGLSRGYLNNPGLTAEKFDQDFWYCQDYQDDNNQKLLPGVQGAPWHGGPIKDGLLAEDVFDNFTFTCNLHLSPWAEKSPPGRRRQKIYRTGDLARWLPDGNIEFLGRIDHQVKIRGFRVELGEIECQLMKQPGIKECVVLTKTHENGDKYLCAYIASDRELLSSELRENLNRDLPEYMIPSHFVFIEKFPLTSNGKIDYRALPEPELKKGEEYIPPRNDLEEKLVQVWAEVLGIDKEIIGIDTDFFELGGHSLRATVMAAKIHQVLHVKVPLAEIFITPTIRGLAQYIRESTQETFINIQPVEKKDYYVISPAQKRLYILQQMQPENIAYNMPEVTYLPKVTASDVERLEHTFLKLIERHESLRTSFVKIDGQILQRVHDMSNLEFQIEHDEITTPLHSKEEQIKRFVRSFNLSRAPLLRVQLIKIKGDYSALIVDTHHIISDGISYNILKQDFTALDSGEKLSNLIIQYKDYAEWQSQQKQRKNMKQQEEYWLKEFDDQVPLLNLPTDYPRPPVQSFFGAVIGFSLGKKETQKLRALALEEKVTLYMLLLSIYTILLSKVTGEQEDIVVGTGIAGRRHADLQEIVGMFVNTLAMRNYPGGDQTFKHFLKKVKERTILAFENQDYPFENLVEAVVKNRDWSRPPLVEAVFVFQNMEKESAKTAELEIPEVKQELYRSENKTAKFDIMLYGAEVDDKLYFALEYCTKLFKEETIELLIRYFKDIISITVENKNIKLKDIKIASNLVAVKEDILNQVQEGDFGL